MKKILILTLATVSIVAKPFDKKYIKATMDLPNMLESIGIGIRKQIHKNCFLDLNVNGLYLLENRRLFVEGGIMLPIKKNYYTGLYIKSGYDKEFLTIPKYCIGYIPDLTKTFHEITLSPIDQKYQFQYTFGYTF